jgi:hypothetical protein
MMQPGHPGARADFTPDQRAMLQTLSDILRDSFAADTFSYIVVGFLAVLAGVMVKAMTDSWPLTILFTPVIWFCALAGIYACRVAGLIFTPDRESNLILSAGAGMVVAVALMLLLVRIGFLMGDQRKPVRRASPRIR